jgi:hypothetical protein
VGSNKPVFTLACQWDQGEELTAMRSSKATKATGVAMQERVVKGLRRMEAVGVQEEDATWRLNAGR